MDDFARHETSPFVIRRSYDGPADRAEPENFCPNPYSAYAERCGSAQKCWVDGPLRLVVVCSRSRIPGSALSISRLGTAVGSPAVPNVRFDALAGSAKRKQSRGLIAGQSEIKDVKVVPHVGAVCRSG